MPELGYIVSFFNSEISPAFKGFYLTTRPSVFNISEMQSTYPLAVEACVCSQMAYGDCGLVAGSSILSYRRKTIPEVKVIPFQHWNVKRGVISQDVPLDTRVAD